MVAWRCTQRNCRAEEARPDRRARDRAHARVRGPARRGPAERLRTLAVVAVVAASDTGVGLRGAWWGPLRRSGIDVLISVPLRVFGLSLRTPRPAAERAENGEPCAPSGGIRGGLVFNFRPPSFASASLSLRGARLRLGESLHSTPASLPSQPYHAYIRAFLFVQLRSARLPIVARGKGAAPSPAPAHVPTDGPADGFAADSRASLLSTRE